MSKHHKKIEAIARASKQAYVLLVDDEEDVTDILAKLLTRNGHLVTVYNNSVKALESFKPGKYDLAIIDIRMPVLNGFQLVKSLKEIDSSLRICYLTAFEVIDEEMAGNDISHESVDCFMKKPIHVSDFIKKVNSQLEDCS